MARANVQLGMVVALAAVIVFSSPAAAARMGHIRQPLDKHLRVHNSHRKGFSLCVPRLAHLLEDHEGRHKFAYDHERGYRAVGVGYNLDDDVDRRRDELAAVRADYDDVYKGDAALSDLQISGLLVMDAQRALDRAAENVKDIDAFCCSVQAVFGDIQHAVGTVENFPQKDLKRFVEKAGSALSKADKEQFESAARELEKTDWCSREEKTERCDDVVDLVARGCFD